MARRRGGIALNVTGIPGVHAALESVKVGIRNKLIKEGMRKTGQGGAKYQKSLITARRTKQLWKSIGTKAISYRGGAVYVVMVGPRKGFKIVGPDGKNVDPNHYAHLVDGGRKALTPTKKKSMTFIVFRGKSGGRVFTKRIKAVRGTPFIGATLAFLRGTAPRFIATAVADGLPREAAKALAKGKSIKG